MDQSRAPVLESILAFRERGDLIFSPPGHKQGRGIDPRVIDVLGAGTFQSDVLALNGWTTAGCRRACWSRPKN